MLAKKMSPEAQAKFTERMRIARAASHESLIRDLTKKAQEQGPDSIWAEMLAEAVAK